jgi:hypothetical protein
MQRQFLGDNNTPLGYGGQYIILYSGTNSETYSGSSIDENYNYTYNWGGGGGGGSAQEGNYWVRYQNYTPNQAFNYNKVGQGDAYSKLFQAWGTLGGTTATPQQSISVNGISSSESLTWPFVSIAAGVATPKPFVTVSQKPETSATSSTAATKTEITKRRIWGEEFFKMTSSQNSSTGTSGSTITPIQAGGAALTSFVFDMNWYGNFPSFHNTKLANGWIKPPTVFIIGGFAQTGESTALIPAGEYANTTLAEYLTFSGSSITNSYFEIQSTQSYLCNIRQVGEWYWPY